jgi:molecular chaperone DnaK
MYADAQAQQAGAAGAAGAAGGGAGASEAKPKEEDVVDADFKEVKDK